MSPTGAKPARDGRFFEKQSTLSRLSVITGGDQEQLEMLKREIDCYPDNLLDCLANETHEDACWWPLRTRSRCEKQLMRRLYQLQVAFFGPTVCRRYRSPNGRMRESFKPLFPGYVFVFGDADSRLVALETGCVSRCLRVTAGGELTDELRQIRQLIATGAPLTPEACLVAGNRVRVKTGAFAGFEGTVLRRDGETRLLVTVGFMQRGASVLLDDCQLESLA